MDKKMVNYLQGFYSYERSFNKRVLADDTEMHDAYKNAQERGSLPFNRTKILILGDHAAGKTSTCRRLQGKEFRDQEPSTIGIETNTVKAKVSDVNSKWSSVSTTPLEDYKISASWWAVSHVSKHGRKPSSSDTATGPDVEVSIRQLIEDTFYQVIHNIPIIVTFLFGGFTFGFGLVVWTYIICLMSIFDVHSAYRFGSGYTIGMVLIDSAMRINEQNREIHGTDLDIWTDVYACITICMYGIVSILGGILMGSGGRTGICIALSFMVHPKQKLFTSANFTDKISIIYNGLYFKLVILIFTIIVIMVYRSVHTKILKSLTRRTCILVSIMLITLFLSFLLLVDRPYFIDIFTLSSIITIVFFASSGVIVGRKCVAYGYIPQVYIIKKCVGFLAGLFIAYFCGWEFVDLRIEITGSRVFTMYLINVMFFLTPIIAFITYEWFAYMKVKHTNSIPIDHIRNSMEANIRNEPYVDATLSLWDFAGQEMYYNTHHLFMPKQAIYLIVFNAVEAILNPEKQIKRLQFWLQSIAMHAEIKNVAVLLVGTRRLCVKMNDLLPFTTLANTYLYKRFSRILAFHPSGGLFFFVENKLNTDKERSILKEAIYSEISKLEFFKESFSIKYLLFKETLKRFHVNKCIITSLNDVSEIAKSTCNIMSKNELRRFLTFFDKSGDVIYNDRDELLRNYVICNPQLLVDFLKCLVNVPERHKRNRTVADFWQKLKDEGIVDSRLMQHICDVQGIWPMYPYIISFLVGTHLLFPLTVTNKVDPVGNYFLGCRLPKLSSTIEIWNRYEHSQDVFYFDFTEILIEFIFLRLIAKCCEEFSWDKVFYNAARFRASRSCLFLITTEKIPAKTDPFERNLIKVSIHNDDTFQVLNILRKIAAFIEEIISREFNPDYFEQYICGRECEKCSSLDGTLSLVNFMTEDVFALDGYRPDHYHKVSLEPKINVTCSRRMRTSFSASEQC